MGAEKIDAAILAHLDWFVRLRMAIEQGSSTFNPDVVSADSSCDFGKWIYGDCPKEWQDQPLFKDIKELHRQFHIEAGRILRLALGGKKEEALAGLGVGAPLRKISTELATKLNKSKSAFAV